MKANEDEEEYFYLIPKELAYLCSTPNEVAVLMELLQWENKARKGGKKTYTTTNGWIAKKFNISKKTVERAKQSLKDKGLIDYKVITKEDKTKETIYTVLQRKKNKKQAQEDLITDEKKCIINNNTSNKYGFAELMEDLDKITEDE